MNSTKAFLMAVALPILLCFASLYSQDRQTPVDMYGKLHVDGSKIVGEDGSPVQLMGMSLYWSIWGGQNFYNRGVVNWLVEDWNIDLIRASMGVDENGRGYVYDMEDQAAYIDTIIEAATDNGIYVIVDWHTHEIHTEEAIAYFSMMAEKYADYPNVIWEIFNEPKKQTWEEIAAYSEVVISAIREHSDNLVLAGTRNWSQYVNEPAAEPLSDDNTAYVLHFYAGTHDLALRVRANNAMNNGIAIFISEWGTTNADGGTVDSKVYKEESDEWIQWAIDNDISMANWSIHKISEASAALNSSASYQGGWNLETDLSESGAYIRNWIKQINDAKYDSGPLRLTVNVDGPGTVEVIPDDTAYTNGDTVTLIAEPGENSRFMFWNGSVSGTSDTVTVIMDNPKRIYANFYDFEAPLVKNGDFADSSENWSSYIHARGDTGASATVDFSDNQARVEIERPGDLQWHVQFYQGDIVLLNRYNYELTFDAVADEPRDITIFMKQNGGEYTEYYGDTISLTTEVQTYTLPFSMLHPTESDARVELNFGEFSDVAVTITNVDLQLIDEMPVKRPYNGKRTGNAALMINNRASSHLVNISFEIKSGDRAVLRIMDLAGRTVARKSVARAGKHNFTFDAGKHSAGVYVLSLKTSDQTLTQKMMIAR